MFICEVNENIELKLNFFSNKLWIFFYEVEFIESVINFLFFIGDCVYVFGYIGSVKFIGSFSELGDGGWIGIELDWEYL